MESVVGNITQYTDMGMISRVSGQDVNVNPELNELLKCLCSILGFKCIWCLDGAKVILKLVAVIKA